MDQKHPNPQSQPFYQSKPQPLQTIDVPEHLRPSDDLRLNVPKANESSDKPDPTCLSTSAFWGTSWHHDKKWGTNRYSNPPFDRYSSPPGARLQKQSAKESQGASGNLIFFGYISSQTSEHEQTNSASTTYLKSPKKMKETVRGPWGSLLGLPTCQSLTRFTVSPKCSWETHSPSARNEGQLTKECGDVRLYGVFFNESVHPEEQLVQDSSQGKPAELKATILTCRAHAANDFKQVPTITLKQLKVLI